MTHPLSNAMLEKFFEPVFRSREVTRAMLDFRADNDVQSRVLMLAGKANEGTLSDEEREEYLAFIEANDLIAIMQLKARNHLEGPSS